jgi:hypothetical protein
MYLSPSIARAELNALSEGRRSQIPVRLLAEYVLNYCTRGAAPNPEPGTHDDSGKFLRSLFALEDRRTPQVCNGAGR